jgi:hypothetical protein
MRYLDGPPVKQVKPVEITAQTRPASRPAVIAARARQTLIKLTQERLIRRLAVTSILSAYPDPAGAGRMTERRVVPLAARPRFR